MKAKKSKHSKNNIKKSNNLRILTLCIFFIMMIVSIVNIVKWVKDNRRSKNITEKVLSNAQIEEDKLLVDFEALKKENEDTVCWLKTPGTNIEYPVVKTQDNEYYLTHSFDKSYNNAGWIFAEANNKFDGTDKHIIIYGHNRRDGSMFGTLKNILEKNWYTDEENKYITLVTEKGNYKYEVFSVYKIENEDYYRTTKFSDTDEFEEFVKILKNRSIYDFGKDVTKRDKILTLSTCADNNKYRVVLHAKKITE